ncbi:hypothetical protein TYRP_003796 [Tyrophagus putrescentiae]|nr:hypothetical protein TYRP_003796 [Tyrophagus putrescentiae]
MSSSGLCLTTCIVRLIYALLLLVTFFVYVYQLHDDQQISFGSTVDHMGKKDPGGGGGETGNDTNGGDHHQHPRYPQHRVLCPWWPFVLETASSWRSPCPLYILLVVLNFLYIGKAWLGLDYLDGYGSLALGSSTSLFGLAYLALLCIGGAEGSGGGSARGGNQPEAAGNIAAKMVNFKNRAPPSDRVKAVLQQQQQQRRSTKKSQK